MNQDFSIAEHLKGQGVPLSARLRIYGIYLLEAVKTLPGEMLADFYPKEEQNRRRELLDTQRKGSIALRMQVFLSESGHTSIEDELEQLEI